MDEDDDSKIFPQRLMEILSEERNHESICWLPHGRAFIVRNRKLFAETVMPQHFSRKAKYSSFARKLNRWNFVRVSSGPEIGAYYHEFFLRDKPHLAAQMYCKNARTKLAMASSDSGHAVVPARTRSNSPNPTKSGATSEAEEEVDNSASRHNSRPTSPQQQQLDRSTGASPAAVLSAAAVSSAAAPQQQQQSQPHPPRPPMHATMPGAVPSAALPRPPALSQQPALQRLPSGQVVQHHQQPMHMQAPPPGLPLQQPGLPGQPQRPPAGLPSDVPLSLLQEILSKGQPAPLAAPAPAAAGPTPSRLLQQAAYANMLMERQIQLLQREQAKRLIMQALQNKQQQAAAAAVQQQGGGAQGAAGMSQTRLLQMQQLMQMQDQQQQQRKRRGHPTNHRASAA